MLFGHNTNVKVGEITYHVQTEDRGTASALIDTTVYFKGRILQRRTNNYFDLLPLDADREATLQLRLDTQHRAVIEDVRGGAIHLPQQSVEQQPAVPANPTEKNAASVGTGVVPQNNAVSSALALELSNARNWLTGKRAMLQVIVRNANGQVVKNANVCARIDGAADANNFTGITNEAGLAQIEFDMPRLASPEGALVIEASQEGAKGQLKFQLRAKPRVPSLS